MDAKELQELWKNTIIKLESKLDQSAIITWFSKTAALKINDSVLIIGVPNSFHQSWLLGKYQSEILESVRELNSEIKKIDFEISTALNNPNNELVVDISSIIKAKNKPPQKKTRSAIKGDIFQKAKQLAKINSKYTLENFVVGDENKLAFATCQGVVSKPGDKYNPLFIYGSVGLGKTHLLHGTANALKKKHPNLRIFYTTSEDFTNELVEAISKRKMNKFKDFYRNCDILIIDDIHFLSNKTQTQIEFFHTFNALYNESKQIILSSDRPPREIKDLEQRLKTRFEMGMMADIQPPDFETKVAILRTKCQDKGLLVSGEVLEFVAEHSGDSVRELEGILTQIEAIMTINNEHPTIDTISRLLNMRMNSNGGIRKKAVRSLKFEDIINYTAEHFDVSYSDVVGKARKKEIATARQVCMYLIRNELNYSYEKIGEIFGGRNHTTVMHSCDKINKQIKHDKNILKVINAIRRDLSL